MSDQVGSAAPGVVIRWPGWATRAAQAGAILSGLFVFTKVILWGVAVLTISTKLAAIEKYLVDDSRKSLETRAQVAELVAKDRAAAAPKTPAPE